MGQFLVALEDLWLAYVTSQTKVASDYHEVYVYAWTEMSGMLKIAFYQMSLKCYEMETAKNDLVNILGNVAVQWHINQLL